MKHCTLEGLPPLVTRRRLLIGLGLALSGCADLQIPPGDPGKPYAPSAPRPFATLDVRGHVDVLQGGRLVPGRDGMPLYRGDEVRTTASSYALCRFIDGDAVWLDYETRVRVGSLFVFVGRVFASVRGVFQIDSEFVAASSEGTEYTVAIGRGTSDFSVAVRSGTVLCRSARRGTWRPIRLQAGQRLVARGTAPPITDRLRARESDAEFGWVPSLRAAPELRVPPRAPIRQGPPTPLKKPPNEPVLR